MKKERVNEAVWLEKYSRWQIKVQLENERKTFYSSKEGTKGKIECEKKADKWLESGKSKAGIRFEQVYNEFFEHKKSEILEKSYKSLKPCGDKQLLSFFKHKKMSAIFENDWQQRLDEMRKQGYSKNYIQKIKHIIIQVLAFAKKNNYEFNPIFDLRVPKKAYAKEHKALTTDELKRLFSDELDNEFYIDTFRFLVLTGMRRGELCALKKEDIKNDIVRITKSANNDGTFTSGKTANAQRVFLLNDEQKKCLNKHFEKSETRGIKSDFVFTNSNGDFLRPTALSLAWKRFTKKHGFEIVLHDLRHTFVSYNKNVPLPLLKQMVGHSVSMDTFKNYGHLIDEDLQTTADYVSNSFKNLL